MIQKIPEEPAVSEKSPRLPTLQGMFYPADAAGLSSLIASFFNTTVTSVSNPKGIVVPHAGYIYSGPAAAVSYAKIDPSFNKTFVIIGTGHEGYPTACADFAWETPLGTVYPDEAYISALEAHLPKNNALLRRRENSLEVQMPFIKYRFPEVKVVPILIGDQSFAGAHKVAEAVIAAAESLGRKAGSDFIVIASGDGSHYVPKETAEHDDLTVLAAAKNLDMKRFYEALETCQPSMCGYGCIAAACEICGHFGAEELRLLTYTTSGDATGDFSEVVGYAAMEVI
ncbi:MAG TPA: AmmeMemoRadiSam system protein B [Methanocorpusculum sp.]|nr:AmmeMemoRadiSam system protein B [Methanocorpusculum sp.]